MRVRKIVAFLLASLLAVSFLTLFSFADREVVALKDSGSPMVSMMLMRSMAANDGISLAAAEGNSGQFGYNIESFIPNYSVRYFDSNLQKVSQLFIPLDESGLYSFDLSFTHSITKAYFSLTSDLVGTQTVQTVNSTSFNYTYQFDSEVPDVLRITVYSPVSSLDEYPQNDLLSLKCSLLYPVEGISCGWSVHEALSQTNTRHRTETFTWNFGSLPAGNYILNIYHYGVSFGVDWDICVGDSVIGENSRFIPISTSDAVSTALVSHAGGDLVLSGTGNFYHSLNSGYTDFTGSFSSFEGSGSISLEGFNRVSWLYAVSDVIVVPLDGAGLEQYGVFGPIVGFFRDQFSSLKLFISSQIDKLAGDDQTQSDVQDAADELYNEVQDLNNLSGQLDTHSSTLEQQFTTDFAIPDFVSGQSSNFQSIYSTLFGSLGVFGIFIWLPVVLAVIKRLLRL